MAPYHSGPCLVLGQEGTEPNDAQEEMSSCLEDAGHIGRRSVSYNRLPLFFVLQPFASAWSGRVQFEWLHPHSLPSLKSQGRCFPFLPQAKISRLEETFTSVLLKTDRGSLSVLTSHRICPASWEQVGEEEEEEEEGKRKKKQKDTRCSHPNHDLFFLAVFISLSVPPSIFLSLSRSLSFSPFGSDSVF